MITCYFGVPGVGKTTFATKIAQKALKRIEKGKSNYKEVYTNFYCKGCKKIEFSDLKDNLIRDSLIVFDELTLDADNRCYKDFPLAIRDFLVLHRHVGVDIVYLTQNYSAIDLKIRHLTQELWYMSRSVIPLLTEFTYAKRIYRQININENTSELTLGYRFCNFLEGLFVSNMKYCFRRQYYKYFDSYEEGKLKGRPLFISETWDSSTKPPKSGEVIEELPDLVVESNKLGLFPNRHKPPDGTVD